MIYCCFKALRYLRLETLIVALKKEPNYSIRLNPTKSLYLFHSDFNCLIFFVFIFGFMNSIGNSSFMTVLQTMIPHEMQGRVFTLVMATSIAVAPLGLTIAGPVAEILGVRSWFLISGFVIVAGALFGLFSPEIKSFEQSLTEGEES